MVRADVVLPIPGVCVCGSATCDGQGLLVYVSQASGIKASRRNAHPCRPKEGQSADQTGRRVDIHSCCRTLRSQYHEAAFRTVIVQSRLAKRSIVELRPSGHSGYRLQSRPYPWLVWCPPKDTTRSTKGFRYKLLSVRAQIAVQSSSCCYANCLRLKDDCTPPRGRSTNSRCGSGRCWTPLRSLE